MFIQDTLSVNPVQIHLSLKFEKRKLEIDKQGFFSSFPGWTLSGHLFRISEYVTVNCLKFKVSQEVLCFLLVSKSAFDSNKYSLETGSP